MARSKDLSAELKTAAKGAWPPTLAFLSWAERTKTTPPETTIADLGEELGITASDAKDLVDGILELKLAQFIVGRKGYPSRLKWRYTLPSIAGTAKGTIKQPVPIAESIVSKDQLIEHELLEQEFRLRPDQKITFKLPEDLTTNEAERLARFIQSLPFTD